MSEIAIATAGSSLNTVRRQRQLNPSARTRDQSGIYTPSGAYVPSRSFCLLFAVAVLLNTFGLIGDPVVWMRQTLPFLMPR
jgi:hypothetical protein